MQLPKKRLSMTEQYDGKIQDKLIFLRISEAVDTKVARSAFHEQNGHCDHMFTICNPLIPHDNTASTIILLYSL